MPVETKVKPQAAKDAEAANPPPPPPVVEPPIPPTTPPETDDEDEGPPAAAARTSPLKVPAEVMAGAKRLYETFQGPGGGFPPYSAALLAAHLLLTKDKAWHMGRTEAEHWLSTFGRLNPVPYFDAKCGNLNGFVAAMKRSNLEVGTAREYTELVSLIQA